MLLFQGVGARIPQFISDPLVEVVWPLWCGTTPMPGWWVGDRFCRNLVSDWVPDWIASLPPVWQFVQFVPLVLAQALALGALFRWCVTGRRS
jgi:hypothetical protein